MANLSNINNKFLVTDEGKVGIGITAPTGILHTDQTFSGYAPVTFKNSVTNQGQFVELITSTDEGSKYTGIESKSLQTGNGWKVWGGGNNFGEMYLSVSGAHAIVIKNDLKVGIGTDSPGKKLTVNAGATSGDGINITGSSSPAIYINETSGTVNSSFQNDGAGSYLGTSTSHPMIFRTANTERMRIESSGNVQIGASSVTNFSLGSSGSDFVLSAKKDGTDPINMVFKTQASGGTLAERIRIKSSGSIYNSNSIQGTYFGQDAGNPASVTGVGNTSIGYAAGQLLTSGTLNVSIGRSASEKLTIGLYNVAVGNNAGYSNVDGQQNTYIGTNAGYTSPGQNYNTFVGYESGKFNTANENTAVGRLSLHQNTTGKYNTAIGMQSLANNTDQDSLTALGYRAGYFWTAGDENTFIGHQSGFGTAAASTGYENTFVGSQTGGSSNGITGLRNTALGRYNLFNLTSGGDNVAIGHQSMITLTDGDKNVAVGKDTMASYTGSKNTAIGYAAGKSINSDGENVFVGFESGKLRTAGIDNVFIGAFAGYSQGTGCCNIAIGRASGYSLTGGVQNTFLGRQAGYSVTTTDNNTIVGHNAGLYATGALNTIVGAQAGTKAGFTGNNNTFLGYTAGDEVTTGGQNLVLGYAAGSGSSPFQLTTQAYRIILGDNSSTDAYIKIDWTVTSDKRDKTDFKEIEHGLDFVDKLKPTEYKFRKNRDTEETDGKRRYGFIAQEILELEGEDSVIIDTEQKDNLKYKQSHLVPVLVKAIQELKAEIELLKNK